MCRYESELLPSQVQGVCKVIFKTIPFFDKEHSRSHIHETHSQPKRS